MAQTGKFIVTIDGPGGSGKDRLAENLVKADIFNPYAVTIVNTGNFSRAIAYDAASNGVLPQDKNFTDFVVQSMKKLEFFKVDSANLHTSEVEKIISSVAAIPQIREGFVAKLPEIIEEAANDVVLVLGRITGSICPNASAKLYLETSPEICAHRRALARSKKGEHYEAVKLALIERNKNDTASWNGNFDFPVDTIIINTDDSLPYDVFEKTSSKIKPIFTNWVVA